MSDITMVVKKPTSKTTYVDLHKKKDVKINKDFRKKYFFGKGFWLPKDFKIEDNTFEEFGHFMVIVCDKTRISELKKIEMDAHIVSYEDFEKTGESFKKFVKRIQEEDHQIKSIIVDSWMDDIGDTTRFQYSSTWTRLINCSDIVSKDCIEFSSEKEEIPGIIIINDMDLYFINDTEKECKKFKRIEFCEGIKKIGEISLSNVNIEKLIFANSVENVEVFRLFEGASIEKIICSAKLKESLVPVLGDKTRFLIK